MVVRAPVNRAIEAIERSFAVPTGGWNTRDALTQMRDTDAAIQTNLLSNTDGVTLREGYSQFCTTGGAHVRFLDTFETPYGERFIAASNKTLYDITSGSASSIKSGLARDDWRGRYMNGRFGLVNGADDPITLTYAPGTGIVHRPLNISGIANPQTLKVLHVHKARSYFATGDEAAFYYSETEVLGGALTKFPIDVVSNSGGNVIDIQSWTVDGGDGPDDYIVLFLNTGEALVYAGSNPGDPDNWSLTNRYKTGRVITATQFAGQIHAATAFDYNVFPRDFPTQGLRPPSKLSGAARLAVREKAGLAGWQILFVPHLALRLVNVPQSISTSHQHVLNLDNGAPALWTELNATRWAVFKGGLYFGDNAGNVRRYGGDSDAGSAIPWEFATAPNRLGSNRNKNVLEYRSIVSADGSLTETTGLGFDYRGPEFVQQSTTEAIGTAWGSPWQSSYWSDEPNTRGEWLSGEGQGQAVQFFSRGAIGGFRPTWRTIDYRYEMSDTH